MAITSQENSLLFALHVSMFNCVPGKEFFELLQFFYEELDKDIYQLSELIYESDIFQDQFIGLEDSEKRDAIMTIFGADSDTEAGQLLALYIDTQLIEGTKEGKIIENILFALPELDSSFNNMKNTILNKVHVAEYYTFVQERSTTDLEIMKGMLSGVTYEDSTVAQAIEDLHVSLSASIDSILIPEGHYTYGGNVNITVYFKDQIYLDGTDVSITLTLGEMQKSASLYSYTDSSLTFNYQIEDGYFSESVEIGVLANSLTLNDTTLLDSSGLNVNTSFEAVQNNLATISDTHSPSYSLFNAQYDRNSNILHIYGDGLDSILEYDEDNNTDIMDRIDFSKLIWDFNGDEDSEYTSSFTFDSTNIISAKVTSSNILTIVLDDASLLEDNENYGSAGGLDTLDIVTGFLRDKAGNISTSITVNDLILGVDGYIVGTLNSEELNGTLNTDTIMGMEGNDTLIGSEGNDILYGGDGHDTLIGGSGIDILSGGEGSDIFVFNGGDSMPAFSENFGIDSIVNLYINSNSEDIIDLDIEVEDINGTVSGSVNESSFIIDMNQLLSIPGDGFNILAQDISAAIINVTEGDLEGKQYLAIDYNANNIFDVDDFIVNITGASLLDFTIDTFI